MPSYRNKKNMQIGVVGAGFVGKATSLLSCKNIKVKIYDKDPEKCSKNVKTLDDLKKSHLIFVCVPTPTKEDGSCHTEIVEECIKDLSKIGYNKFDIVVRSTVPIGFCEKNGVSHMPEFLTELNWEQDFKKCNARLFGIPNFKSFGSSVVNHPTIFKVRNLFEIAKQNELVDSNVIEFTTCNLSETAKLVRNAFLATKVSFFNEVYDLCLAYGMNYSAIKKMVTYDERIGESHTEVPCGGKRGFGGTCLPKDLKSLIKSFEEKDLKFYLLKNVDARNDELDRPEKDWAKDKGRSSI